jgi:hypothetical protein
MAQTTSDCPHAGRGGTRLIRDVAKPIAALEDDRSVTNGDDGDARSAPGGHRPFDLRVEAIELRVQLGRYREGWRRGRSRRRGRRVHRCD